MEAIHVYPNNDTHEHTLISIATFGEVEWICLCDCGPKLIIENDTPIFVHNSFDGREGVEWARELI